MDVVAVVAQNEFFKSTAMDQRTEPALKKMDQEQ